jgi:hypothetical protein
MMMEEMEQASLETAGQKEETNEAPARIGRSPTGTKPIKGMPIQLPEATDAASLPPPGYSLELTTTTTTLEEETPERSITPPPPPPAEVSSKMEALEMGPEDMDIEDIDLQNISMEEHDDMESLLGTTSTKNASEKSQKSKTRRNTKTYCYGRVTPQPIGNMQIFFPAYFHSHGFGVLGPHWFGPLCVWGILILATHFCGKAAMAIGPISTLICYISFGACTFLLVDVSLRDPGICLHKTIPETTPQEQMTGWRWCDFCQVFQPPDGAHCPDCNVCVAGMYCYCIVIDSVCEDDACARLSYRNCPLTQIPHLLCILYLQDTIIIVFGWVRVLASGTIDNLYDSTFRGCIIYFMPFFGFGL